MPKSSFIQSMKPFVRYCMIITPVILIITAFTSGIFTTQTPTVGADVGALNNKKDTEMGVALLPSTKYAAVDVKGLHRNNDVKVVAAEKFSDLIVAAKNHPRKRKMNDLTKNAESNSMQTLINTWTDGSYSPVHKHVDYSEVMCYGGRFIKFRNAGMQTFKVFFYL